MRKQHVVVALVGLAVVAGLGALLFGEAWWRQGGPVALRPDDARVLALGQKVYAAQCAACHGANLEGQPNWQVPGPDGRLPAPPHDATGHTWHHPDDLLFRSTKLGVAKAANLKDHASTMPAYEGVLSDEEIVAVLSWIKSRWPPQIRARHDRLNEHARAAR